MTEKPDKCLKKKSVAERLGVSTKTLERMVSRGEFPEGFKRGGSHLRYWRESVVEAYMERLAGVPA